MSLGRRRERRARPSRCSYKGCTRPPLEGERSCAEHFEFFERIRAELAAGPTKRVVQRGGRAPLRCADPDCDAPRIYGSQYCWEHDGA